MTGNSSANTTAHGIPFSLPSEAEWSVTEKGSIYTTVSNDHQGQVESITDVASRDSGGSICLSDTQRHDSRGLMNRSSCFQGSSQLEYFPGITTEKPKHPDYGIKSVRLSSFTNWHHKKIDPTALAEAGFFYRGDRDWVTCFFCGGGMKNWEEGDNPWIEHARWYPNCAFVKQCKGENFVTMCRMANIDYVTADGQMKNPMTASENIANCGIHIEDQLIEDLNSTAAKLVMDMGYRQEELELAIKHAREKYGSSELRAQYLLEYLLDNNYTSCNHKPSGANNKDPPYASERNVCVTNSGNNKQNCPEQQALLEENRQLRTQMACKICMDKDACVVFLPCGHMASCVVCAFALRKCAICRSLIQGTIRTYLV